MNKQRILICGDRNWTNKKRLFDVMIRIVRKHDTECIIEGEAKGADTMGREFGEYYKIPVLKFPEDWNKYHKGAGPIRNKQMLMEGLPTLIIGFHNNIDQSKGTKNMLYLAKNLSVKTLLVTDTEIKEY